MDIERSKRFYDTVLPPLGMDKDEVKAWYLKLKAKGAAEE